MTRRSSTRYRNEQKQYANHTRSRQRVIPEAVVDRLTELGRLNIKPVRTETEEARRAELRQLCQFQLNRIHRKTRLQ